MLLVATATEMEMKAALGGLAPLPRLEQGVPVRWEGTDILLLVTGVSILNTALYMGKALARHEIHGVLNLGVAGAFDIEALPLTTTCVVQWETWPEFGLGTDHGVDPDALGFPLARTVVDDVDPSLSFNVNAYAARLGLDLPAAWPRVSALTVSTVSGTAKRARELHERYGVDLESMEGFAFFYACGAIGLPVVEIRVVSNLVGARSPRFWDIEGAKAALGDAAARMLRQIMPAVC